MTRCGCKPGCLCTSCPTCALKRGKEVAEELRESLSIGLIPTAEGIRLIADRLDGREAI